MCDIETMDVVPVMEGEGEGEGYRSVMRCEARGDDGSEKVKGEK